MKWSLRIGLMFALIAVATVCSQTSPVVVNFNALADDPNKFVGKEVRFTGNYRYGFEWAYLCDSLCRNRPVGIWVDFSEELCKDSEKKMKVGRKAKFDNIASVIFIGRIDAGGFGHLGAYPFRIRVKCVEQFKLLALPKTDVGFGN